MKIRSRPTWGGPYQIDVSFRVPLDFAFAWCTDYTPDDAKLEGESYQRKIIERSRRRVVFEDLEETKDGWVWGQDVGTLLRQGGWHVDGGGHRRDVPAEERPKNVPERRARRHL